MNLNEPTAGYLAAPEVSRKRLSCEVGGVKVVVEEYATPAEPFGAATCFLSLTEFSSAEQLGWAVHWLSQWKKLARQWPPHNIQKVTVEPGVVSLEYFEATYDGPVDCKATYHIKERRWHLY